MKKIISQNISDGEFEYLNISIFPHDIETMKKIVTNAFDILEDETGRRILSIMLCKEIDIDEVDFLFMIDQAKDITDQEIETLNKFNINGNINILDYLIK